MNKKLLIAAFVKKNESERFLKYIFEEFDIEESKAFIYESLDDDSQYILTFYIEVEIGERLNLRDHFKNALIIHKKKTSFYTINALNKLIEKEFDLTGGNIDYKKWQIDWTKYQNNLILTSNKNLLLIPLKRVF